MKNSPKGWAASAAQPFFCMTLSSRLLIRKFGRVKRFLKKTGQKISPGLSGIGVLAGRHPQQEPDLKERFPFRQAASFHGFRPQPQGSTEQELANFNEYSLCNNVADQTDPEATDCRNKKKDCPDHLNKYSHAFWKVGYHLFFYGSAGLFRLSLPGSNQ